jgi:hypothetical protein
MASVIKDWIAPKVEKGLSEELENLILRGNSVAQGASSFAIKLQKGGYVQLVDV